MKSFKILITLLIVLAVTAFLTSTSYADQIQPYIKIGGEEVVENGISEGHKAIGLLGIKIVDESKLEKIYLLEGWSMIEAEDEDPEMLHYGFKVGTEFKYQFDKFPVHPYAGLNFEHWQRNQNEKYFNSFKQIHFLDTTFGLVSEYKHLYLKVGGIYPIWSEADNSNPSGELSLNTEIGLKWKRIEVGYSYRNISFSGDGPQPDIESNFSCIKIGYNF